MVSEPLDRSRVEITEELVNDVEIYGTSNTRIVMKCLFNVKGLLYISCLSHIHLVNLLLHCITVSWWKRRASFCFLLLMILFLLLNLVLRLQWTSNAVFQIRLPDVEETCVDIVPIERFWSAKCAGEARFWSRKFLTCSENDGLKTVKCYMKEAFCFLKHLSVFTTATDMFLWADQCSLHIYKSFLISHRNQIICFNNVLMLL